MRGAKGRSRTASSNGAQVVAVVTIASLLVACGSANVNTLKRYRGMPLPAPTGIVVYPFDASSPDLGSAANKPPDPDDEARRREVARVLAKRLVKELEDRGLPASLGSGPPTVPPGMMAVGGRVVRVDPGSQMGRILIGFGYGRTRTSSIASLQGEADGEQVTLFEFQNTAKSGPKPGILTTLPIGFLVNGVSLLAIVISGGMAGIGELSADVAADAKRTADELAKAIAESMSQVSRSD